MKRGTRRGLGVITVAILIGGGVVVWHRARQPGSEPVAPGPPAPSPAATEVAGSAAVDHPLDRTNVLAHPGAGSAARARGITFDTPGSLAKIPSHYELSTSNGVVFVNLAGGPSTLYAPRPAPAGSEHTFHARVVDRADHPVAGAIVLVDDRPAIVGGHLRGRAGAVSDVQGEVAFEAPTTAAFAIAFDADGWSQLVPIGDGDAPLVLTLIGRGALAGRATYNNHGESFSLNLLGKATGDLRVSYETNPDGTFTIASLPPGDYTMSIGLAQEITGGESKHDERDVTIVDGQTTEVRVDQTSATIVVVTPHFADDYKPMTIEYYMLSGAGAADPAAAKTRARAEHAPELLFGGKDALVPVQFHDVAAGKYTVCAAADDTARYGCTPVTVLDGDPAREVTVALAAPTGARAP